MNLDLVPGLRIKVQIAGSQGSRTHGGKFHIMSIRWE